MISSYGNQSEAKRASEGSNRIHLSSIVCPLRGIDATCTQSIYKININIIEAVTQIVVILTICISSTKLSSACIGKSVGNVNNHPLFPMRINKYILLFCINTRKYKNHFSMFRTIHIISNLHLNNYIVIPKKKKGNEKYQDNIKYVLTLYMAFY